MGRGGEMCPRLIFQRLTIKRIMKDGFLAPAPSKQAQILLFVSSPSLACALKSFALVFVVPPWPGVLTASWPGPPSKSG